MSDVFWQVAVHNNLDNNTVACRRRLTLRYEFDAAMTCHVMLPTAYLALTMSNELEF